jgi:hypothetical protein
MMAKRAKILIFGKNYRLWEHFMHMTLGAFITRILTRTMPTRLATFW